MTKLLPPSFLRQLSSDEYRPEPYSHTDLRVLFDTGEVLDRTMRRRRLTPLQLNGDRLGTAAGLLAINGAWNTDFYQIDKEAVVDDDAAAEAFRGQGIVVDVQTHFMAPHASRVITKDFLCGMYREVMPDWWREMDDIVAWDIAEYITNVFLECETAVAVLTSGPGLDDSRNLFNDEIAASRALIDTFAGRGRLLSHAVVHADIPDEFNAMEEWRDRYDPVGWKVYTPGRIGPNGWTDGWMLDDERHGYPFLERARALGVNLICAHKGISLLVDNGSPRDIGPAARAFPDLNFVVYHAGYEFPAAGAPPEGPFTEQTRGDGINRLIATAMDAGLGRGCNIYPELGSTWFSLVRRPIEAAHVLGKLIAAFGEDNVIWGSDSIWYGSAQPILDAFRVFQIPDWMCEQFGYQPLTPAIKEKILGLNAARLYGIDMVAAARNARDDDLAWARHLLRDLKKTGFAALR